MHAGESHVPSGGILASLISLVDHVQWRLASGYCLLQQTRDKAFCHTIAQRPADYSSREPIHQGRQVTEAVARDRNICDVSDPQFVDPCGLGEFENKIWTVAQGVPTFGASRLERLWLNRLQPRNFHECCHPIATACVSAMTEFFGDPPRSVSPPMNMENRPDHRE